jgi:hypothetical protein
VPMVFRSTSALDGLLVSFDASATYLSVISKHDGRIRVFNAVSGSLRVDLSKKLSPKGEEFSSRICSSCWSAEVQSLRVNSQIAAVLWSLAERDVVNLVCACIIYPFALASFPRDR